MIHLHLRIFYGVKESIKNRLSEDYSTRKTKVNIKVSDDEREITLGRLFLNIVFLEPLIKNNIKIIPEDIFMGGLTQKSAEKQFNYLLKRFRENNIDYNLGRNYLANIINELSDLSAEKNSIVGNSISFRDFVRIEVEDPEGEKLFSPEVKQGSFSDIESQFAVSGNNLLDYFKRHHEAELHPFVVSETGINKKQFTQFGKFIGLKPNIDGTVIPVTITDNFLHGLSGIENYFINAKGTKLALLTNSKMTRRSGYLTRKLSLSNIDHYHDNNIKDCGTKHFVVINIDNKRKLRQFIGRHYYKINQETFEKLSDELFTIENNSEELIGQKIGLRSPVTCAGKHVCATCYGRTLSEVNKDVNSGLVAVNKLTEQLTQRLLSAKHCATCC